MHNIISLCYCLNPHKIIITVVLFVVAKVVMVYRSFIFDDVDGNSNQWEAMSTSDVGVSPSTSKQFGNAPPFPSA